jgi:hypothetical protein
LVTSNTFNLGSPNSKAIIAEVAGSRLAFKMPL